MGILIASKRDGFRRAGVEHSSAPTLYADDRFTEEQLAALKAEPMLIVHEVDDEPKGVNEDGQQQPEDGKPEDEKPKGKAAKDKAPETGDA